MGLWYWRRREDKLNKQGEVVTQGGDMVPMPNIEPGQVTLAPPVAVNVPEPNVAKVEKHYCILCGKPFRKVGPFAAHFRMKHPDEYEDRESYKDFYETRLE